MTHSPKKKRAKPKPFVAYAAYANDGVIFCIRHTKAQLKRVLPDALLVAKGICRVKVVPL